MKNASIVAGLSVCLALTFVVTQSDAVAEQAPGVRQQVSQVAIGQQPIVNPRPEMLAKKCSFSSDCSHGKCKKGRCGGCSFTSDCKGWGKCSKGWCGACSFSSDCKGFGTCSSGRCTKSPY